MFFHLRKAFLPKSRFITLTTHSTLKLVPHPRRFMSSTAYTEAWLSGPRSTQFYTRTYVPAPETPTKAVVVAVHGFAEHIGRYGHFHPLLAEKGIVVFAYDQRGFGLTAQDTTGKKSADSAYGKTSWGAQMGDLEWALGYAKKTYGDTPLFLLGHSMGGGEALGFATQDDKYRATIDSLAGVIATSPLILQTTPAPKALKWVGGKLSSIMPNMLFPAEVKAEQLSHDPEVNATYLKDPLVKQSGSLRGINDMLNYGESLLKDGINKWPQNLPLIIIHGTDDKVTSPQASQTFHDKITTSKKKIMLFPGGYHELQNEPDGVKEKLAAEIISFIEDNVSITPTNPSETEAVQTAVPEEGVKAKLTEEAIAIKERTIPTDVVANKAKM